MICTPDKTVSNYAAQIWIEKVSENTMDSFELGKTIGRLEYYELHPLKRFTDLVYESMWNISPLHNQVLLKLIEGIITESNPKPIKNTKKLLEIYSELLTQTSNKPGKEVIPILKQWQQTSLKKTVTPLLV